MPSPYDLSRLNVDGYWQLVRRTVEQVFSGSPSAVDPLEAEIRSTSPDEQLSFYHIEPLTIAAEITDKKPTPQELSQYKWLRQQVYQLP